MPTITTILASEVLDSRGNPTVEVELTLSDGACGRAIVPSGASTGVHEALELRDGDASRYLGKWVLKALHNIDTIIAPALIGRDITDVYTLDKLLNGLDGTPNKSHLGANAILAVSMAWIVATAQSQKTPVYGLLADQMMHSTYYSWSPKSTTWTLPIPLMNIINGGSHADNTLDFQECMIVPVGASNFREAVRMGAEVFHHLKKILTKHQYSTAVGDEGGYAPNVVSNAEALDLIITAIQAAGYTTDQVKLALDVASSEFYRDGMYHLDGEGKTLSSAELVDFYADLCARYPIISIEDGMAEDDFEGWKLLTSRLGKTIKQVGDDLFVTNVARLRQGIDEHWANAILIKLNQIGSVSETLDAILMAQTAGMRTIISHRSGETEDVFIAHLAVATGAGFIKTGSLSRTDRVAKYNELMRIEGSLPISHYGL